MNGRELGEPIKHYEEFIGELVKRAAESGEGDETKNLKYAVSLVCHLSTSGFIVPLIYTEKLFHQQLPKLGPKKNPEAVAARFWDLYFQTVHLTFWHQGIDDGSIPTNATVFSFTYENSSTLETLKLATPYLSDMKGIDPSDVLVLSARPGQAAYETIKYLQDTEDVRQKAAVAAMGKIKGDLDALKAEFEKAHPTAKWKTPHWHQRIGLSNDMQENFENYVHALFLPQPCSGDVCCKPLHDRWSRWYEGGNYDFTAREIIALLSHDQWIRKFEMDAEPAGALVLSGGGVRGTYQAALLDKLYDGKNLINFGEAKNLRLAPRDGMMILRHIIGTSGGALVGYFAAQRSSGTGRDKERLVQEWIKGDDVVATPQR